MNTMTHYSAWVSKRFTWIIAIIFSCLGLYTAFHYFPVVFPLLNLDLKINKTQALQQAELFVKQHQIQPLLCKSSVLFQTDEETKNFIELEGGGKETLTRIIWEKEYTPYYWDIRHFNEGSIEETSIQLAPDGRLYGFTQTIAETDKRPSVSQEEAQLLAEQSARGIIPIDFLKYTLTEQAQQEHRNGRIDHTLVYQHSDKKVGTAPYCLQLKLSGNTLTQIKQFIKVPESFKRSYKHMRSFNTNLALAASFLRLFLYMLCIGTFGIFYLIRYNYFIWKPALIWAFFIAICQAGTLLNSLPLLWHSYDTALSGNSFLLHFFIMLLKTFLLEWGQLFFIFSVAEGLTRIAFADHIQLWRTWSMSVASTWQVLGRTVGAYLLLGWDFFFVIIFYAITLHWFNWWSPAEAFVEPNMLSFYAPWFFSLANSLYAGFMEECLFRAIPLASAALIGKHYKKEKLFLIIALIGQACIFGAAHANYPAQPYYARLVELIIPSLVFGVVYLYYGLITVIISHYVYDVIWFALPLFISTAPGIWFDRCLVVIGATVPLAIVFYARYKNKKWHKASDDDYNKAWHPTDRQSSQKNNSDRHSSEYLITNRTIKIIFFTGISSLLLWLFFSPFYHNSLPIQLTYNEAYKTGESLIDTLHLQKDHWTILARVENQFSDQNSNVTVEKSENNNDEAITLPSQADQHLFIWEKANRQTYEQLLGKYLETPHWIVRLAQFNGDTIQQQAEEYKAYIHQGAPFRIEHIRPEGSPGKMMATEDAHQTARTGLKQYDNLHEGDFQELVIHPEKKPARFDWTFIVKNIIASKDFFDASIKIAMSDNQIDNYEYFISIPENWKRVKQQKFLFLMLITALSAMVLLFFKISGVFCALYVWALRQFSIKTFLLVMALLILKTILQLWNLLPSFIFNFETNQPYIHQMFNLILRVILQSASRIVPIALIAGLIWGTPKKTSSKHLSFHMLILLGCALGFIPLLANLITTQLGDGCLQPIWPDFTYATARIAWLSLVLANLTDYLTVTILFLYGVYLLSLLPNRYNHLLSYVALITSGLCIAAIDTPTSVSCWAIEGLLLGTIFVIEYIWVYRYAINIIPLSIALFFSCNALKQAYYNAFPYAVYGNFILILILITLGITLQYTLTDKHQSYSKQ